MPSAPLTPSAGGRVTALDAVRGIAILGVIATHSLTATIASTGSSLFPPELFRVFSYGEFGVQLFFVLSGWLMFALYTGDKPFSQAAFWSRRWARIWPLWLIFVGISFAVFGAPDSGYPGWLSLVLCALFLGWTSAALVGVPTGGLTIQQEMGHYLLFSLFRRRSVAFLAGTVIVGYATMVAARGVEAVSSDETWVDSVAAAWLRLSIFNSWPFFLLGGAGCALLRTWRRGGIHSLVPHSSGTSLIVGAALVGSLFTTYAQDTPGYFVLGFVLLCAAIAVAANPIPGIGTALRSIGRYSYFMYFFHFWVLRGVERWYPDSGLPYGASTSMVFNVALLMVIAIFTTGVSWAAGLVSWNLLEKRVMAWVHRRVPNPASTPAPTP